jgi:hypothetical protein
MNNVLSERIQKNGCEAKVKYFYYLLIVDNS